MSLFNLFKSKQVKPVVDHGQLKKAIEDNKVLKSEIANLEQSLVVLKQKHIEATTRLITHRHKVETVARGIMGGLVQ